MTVALYLQKVGREVRAEREALGLTQAEVAEAMGVSDSAISSWELGTANMSVVSDRRLRAFFRQKRREAEAAQQAAQVIL